MQLARRRAGHVEDLAAQGQDGLGGAVARLFGAAARAVTFHQEDFGAVGRALGAVGQLAGQAQLARRRLALGFLFLALLQPVLGAVDHETQQAVGLRRAFRQPVIEMVAHHGFHQALGVGAGQLVLGLALEFRLADKDRQHGAGRVHHIVGGDQRRLAVVGALAMGAQRLGQGVAKALFVGAAHRSGNGVAIGAGEGIAAGRPGHRPFHRATPVFIFGAAREIALVDGLGLADLAAQEVQQAAGKFQRVLGGRLVGDQRRIADPVDFHAPEQIGLGLGGAVQPRRGELQVAENLFVRAEGDDGATAVHRAQILQLAHGLAALEPHLPGVLVAGDLDFHPFRQGVDDRRAHAVQAAGGLIGLAVELSARMKRGHDDFQRRFVLEFGVRVHRDAASIVPHEQDVAGLELDLDAAGVSGDRFVHGVVHDLGRQMMQGVGIRAADIHAGAAAHGLQPLQHLDILGGVALGGGGGTVEQIGFRFAGHDAFGERVADESAGTANRPSGGLFLRSINHQKRAESPMGAAGMKKQILRRPAG